MGQGFASAAVMEKNKVGGAPKWTIEGFPSFICFPRPTFLFSNVCFDDGASNAAGKVSCREP